LKQDYRITQLEYELALLKLNQTEPVTSQVEEAKMAYEQATRDFQSFWDNKLPTD
jgi:archaellum component FlaC